MKTLKKIQAFFTKKKDIVPNYERTMRDLLRENLSTIPVDVFHHDDPLLQMGPEERKVYLAYFRSVVVDGKLIDRLKYLINKQANRTLYSSKDGVLDSAGVMKMDGIASIKDDIERLSAMFLKEESETPSMDPREALRL